MQRRSAARLRWVGLRDKGSFVLDDKEEPHGVKALGRGPRKFGCLFLLLTPGLVIEQNFDRWGVAGVLAIEVTHPMQTAGQSRRLYLTLHLCANRLPGIGRKSPAQPDRAKGNGARISPNVPGRNLRVVGGLPQKRRAQSMKGGTLKARAGVFESGIGIRTNPSEGLHNMLAGGQRGHEVRLQKQALGCWR